MIKRLAHLCFKTNRFVEMAAFYRDTMGLPEQFTMDLPDGTVFGRYFALGNQTFLEIFDDAGSSKMWGNGSVVQRQAAPTGFYQHFCLEVGSEKGGIDALRTALIAKGVDVGPVKTGMDGSRQCWLKDPDGNSIELMEYTPQSKQLKAL